VQVNVGSEKLRLDDEDGRDELLKDTSIEGSVVLNGDNEKAPLLGNGNEPVAKVAGWRLVTKRVVNTLIESIRWVLSTLAAPGVYLVACFYDDRQFSPLRPVRFIGRVLSSRKNTSTAQAVGISASPDGDETLQTDTEGPNQRQITLSSWQPLTTSSQSLGSDSEADDAQQSIQDHDDENPARHSRSKSSNEITPSRRSIRIKLYNEDSLRQRKHRKMPSATTAVDNNSGGVDSTDQQAALLKSPTSPASSLRMTKYPRAPEPPRPLIPRRLPSYSPGLRSITLIIDLDETLIHSMAKGGRMSTGHMVEVKLNTPVGIGCGASISPQHPILYYVHKRPHCDEFLRKVSR
jgi:CTD nuclear envelope phosphatase 1